MTCSPVSEQYVHVQSVAGRKAESAAQGRTPDPLEADQVQIVAGPENEPAASGVGIIVVLIAGSLLSILCAILYFTISPLAAVAVYLAFTAAPLTYVVYTLLVLPG